LQKSGYLETYQRQKTVCRVGRGRAKFKESDVRRIFNAARKVGVHVRIEFCEGGIVATTIDEATAKSNLSADDELANWRRKKGNES
jgi:hypothetical protein